MHETLLFIDFEASSLEEGSYPIELGWASIMGASGVLIRPEESWTDWNPASEVVHGIPRDQLLREGMPAPQVAANFLELASGRFLVSDAPSHDFAWLKRLLRLTDVPPYQWPRISDNSQVEWVETARLLSAAPPKGISIQTERLRCLQAGNLARKEFPGIRHRAEPDAQRLLHGYQAVRHAVTALLESWQETERDG